MWTMARFLFLLAFGSLICKECSTRSLSESEESVVSVYTTQSSMSGASIDVYHQIANNIAEKITSPIYNFLGFGKNKSETTTTKRPWSKVELLDEPEEKTKANRKPVDNDISNDKDVEELSSDGFLKTDKKPEKITLYSSYLPSGKIEKLDGNDTVNEISDDDETFDFDEVEDSKEEKPRGSSFIYFLEVVGNIIQLIYSGIVALFSSRKSNN